MKIRWISLFLATCSIPFYVFSQEHIAHKEALQMVAMLEYIMGDYSEAVAIQGGKIESETEYTIFLKLASDLQEKGQTLGIDNASPLHGFINHLEKSIQNKAPLTEVLSIAINARNEIVKLYSISTYPEKIPNIQRGAELYVEACSVCHGISGLADTPSAQQIAPPVRVLRDREYLNKTTPFKVYNTITFGVHGTAMPEFSILPDEDRWAIASYVFTLRPDLPNLKSEENIPIIPWKVATGLTDGEILRRFETAGSSLEKAVSELSAIRYLRYPLETIPSIFSISQRLNPAHPYWSSLINVFEEGFWAVLFLGFTFSIITYVRTSDRALIIHAAWLTTVIGFFVWFNMKGLLTSSLYGKIEGFVLLVAVGLSVVGIVQWMICRTVQNAFFTFLLVSSMVLMVFRAIFAIATFLWVLRLSPDVRGIWITLGSCCGISALLLMLWLMDEFAKKCHRKIPMVYLLISLYMLSIVCAGKGIHFLQEVNQVSSRNIPFFKIPLLGIFPTLLTVSSQIGMVLVILCVLLLRSYQNSRRRGIENRRGNS